MAVAIEGAGAGAGWTGRAELKGEVCDGREFSVLALATVSRATGWTAGDCCSERIFEKTIKAAIPAQSTTTKMTVFRDMTSMAAKDSVV